MLTTQQLALIIPTNKLSFDWLDEVNDILPKFEINSTMRIAAFLAQCAHESGDFTILKENLNYKATGLMATWPKRFPTMEIALQYERQPEKIGNHVYANRLGNGDETSGDGFKYRGRGILQITGKDNYKNASNAIYSDDRLIDQPTLLEESDGAMRSACWFWQINKLNALADVGKITEITQRINGGQIGSVDREARYKNALRVLGGK